MPTRSSRVGHVLIGLGVLAGTLVTLYRNGIVFDVARALHQENAYQQFEAALGGPSFGTLRAVEARQSQRLLADHGDPASAAAQSSSPSDSRLGDSAARAEASPPAVSLDPAKPAESAPLTEPAVSTPKPAPASARAAKGASTKPQTSRKQGASPSEAQRLNTAMGDSISGSKSRGKAAKGKSNEYDPLNPKL